LQTSEGSEHGWVARDIFCFMYYQMKSYRNKTEQTNWSIFRKISETQISPLKIRKSLEISVSSLTLYMEQYLMLF
jgi:hypothetical protein